MHTLMIGSCFFLFAIASTTLATSHNNNNNNINYNVDIAMFIHGGAEIEQQQQNQHPIQPTSRNEGGEHTSLSSPFVAMSECSFISSTPTLQDKINFFESMDEHNSLFDDDEDDDDDDDDNDGHSSMLSNASIRKCVVSTAAATTASYYSYSGDNGSAYNNGGSYMTTSGSLVQRVNKFRRNFNQGSISSKINTAPSSTMNQILNVRGGAAAGSAGVAAADEFAKRLIAAALVTVLYEGVIGHILEFLKIAMQTADVGTTYMDILKKITQEKGIAGCWDGFVPWGVVQSVAKGGVFGLAHAMSKEVLHGLVEKGLIGEQLALTMAGGVAGGFQGFVLSPLLLLKTRVMTNPVFREKMSMLRTTYLSLTIGLEVVKNEGLLALMKGADIFSLKRVFDWSTRYYFSDFFKAAMISSGFGVDGVLTQGDKIVASLLGGFMSTVCTLPLDVIVAKSQDAKKAGVKVSAWDTFMKDYEENGIKGLYDANMMGFEARLLHVCFTTVVMQMGSPIMFDFLFGKQ